MCRSWSSQAPTPCPMMHGRPLPRGTGHDPTTREAQGPSVTECREGRHAARTLESIDTSCRAWNGEESCLLGDGIIAGGTLPAVLTVMARQAVRPGYLLDAETQVVDTVRFVSFAVGSSDLSHKLGQTIVELGS